ncbi:MAG: cytochrome c [Paracoccus sp. (in: a-proteobacteria)]|nr:cytochrome c [Paracoccus sp. (in: a-proteobacteria)]
MRLSLLAAASLLAALPLASYARDSEAVDAALESRQGYFTMLNVNMGTLAGMARGTVEYDEATARQAGDNLQALGAYDVSVHFLPGTSNTDLAGRTQARAIIWENPDDFAAKAAALREATAGAGEAVASGQAAIGPVIGAIGGTCKACHDNYRSN